MKATTPVVKSRIVVLCKDHTKADMTDRIERAFQQRGLSPKQTRVGWDVIFRVGDPTDPQDLRMVGAHNAIGGSRQH